MTEAGMMLAAAAIKLTVTVVSLSFAGAVLASRPRSSVNQFLSGFLVLIGSSYALDAAWTIAWMRQDAGAAARIFQLEMVFNILDPLVLLYLLTIFPARQRWNNVALFAGLGAIACYLLFEVVRGPTQFAFYPPPLLGPDGWTLATYPFSRLVYNGEVILVYALCFALAVRHASDAVPGESTARTLICFAVAVALLPRITSSLIDVVDPFGLGIRTLADGWGPHLGDAPAWQSIVSAFVRIGLALVVLAWAAIMLKPAGAGARIARRPILLGASVFMIPFALDLRIVLQVESQAVNDVLFLINAGGFALRWLAFGALFGIALLHAQLFDLERKLRRAASITLVLLAFAGALCISILALVTTRTAPPVLLVTLGAATLAAGGAVPLARARITRLFPQADDPDYLQERKIEVFQAAIQDSRARGRDPERDPHVIAFRKKLGLSEHTHRRLVERAPRAAEPTAALVLPGELLLGRYRIERLLGSGGAGRTWLARDEILQRDVAIKQVFGRQPHENDHVARMVREASIAGRLRHANVVLLLDAQAAGLDYLLVMEHVAGGTLAERIERDGALRGREAARILDGILAALESVHAHNILHRDIKPSNVLLTSKGVPKLADFGAALLVDVERTATRGPSLTAHAGTLRYMSPEQASGLPIGAQADLFSAAVVAHECLTGRPFVDPRMPPEAMFQAVLRPAPGLRGVDASTGLRTVLAKALEPRPADRYQSARDFRRALAVTDEMQGPA